MDFGQLRPTGVSGFGVEELRFEHRLSDRGVLGAVFRLMIISIPTKTGLSSEPLQGLDA